MNKGKLISESKNSSKQPSEDRRSFIWKTGAAVTAVLASAVAEISKTKTNPDAALRGQIDQLSNQLGRLEDANAIRKLHRTYEQHLDNYRYEEAVGMFAEDAEVSFNGGVFLGKNKGVRRLYHDHFSQGMVGKKVEPAPECELNAAKQQEVVEVAPDRKSATARFPYSMQMGIPIISDSQLVKMARLQGQGIRRWREGGICEIAYVKDGEGWKIQRLVYKTTWQVDHALGGAYTKAASIPVFAKSYPENPTGPDRILGSDHGIIRQVL